MSDHNYQWDSLSRVHICTRCGTARHKSCWWLAGKKYDSEPSCISTANRVTMREMQAAPGVAIDEPGRE